MSAEYARAIVDDAPPLTEEQRARLAAILRGRPNDGTPAEAGAPDASSETGAAITEGGAHEAA
jgi:hypothetical protein